MAIPDHWYPGAIAAMQTWYTIAARRARDVAFLRRCWHPQASGWARPRTRKEAWPPLVPVGEDLVVVGDDGEIQAHRGRMTPDPTDEERAAIAEAARTRRCACQLCKA